MFKYSTRLLLLFFYLNIYTYSIASVSNCEFFEVMERSSVASLSSAFEERIEPSPHTLNKCSGIHTCTFSQLESLELGSLVSKLEDTLLLAIQGRNPEMGELDSHGLLILAAALRQNNSLTSLKINAGNFSPSDWWRLGCGLRGNKNVKVLEITHPTLNEDGLHQLFKGVSNRSNITTLSLQASPSLRLPDNFKTLSKIESLALRNCNFTENDVEIISSLPLRRIRLNDTPLSKERIGYLSRLTSLTSLSLDRCSITEEMLPPLATITNLEDLSLQENELMISDSQNLPVLSKLSNLNLNNNKIDDIGRLFKVFPNISTIHLYNNCIKDEGVFSFFEKYVWQDPSLTLKYFNINGNDVSKSSIIACEVLLNVKDKQSVFDFNYETYSIYPKKERNKAHPTKILGSRELKDLLKSPIMKLNPCFSEIYLRGASLNDEDAQFLEEILKKNSTLTHLTLCNNYISDQGAKSLAEGIAENSSLTTLNLNQNPISIIGKTLLLTEIRKSVSSLKLLLDEDLDIDSCEGQYEVAQGYFKLGDGQNCQEAACWYRKAAEQGHAGAQFSLGFMYAKGKGIEKNESKAVECYRKAAEQGHAGAQNNLGWLHENWRGSSLDNLETQGENDKRAIEWYKKAAKQSNAIGQYNLAWMYENGFGVPPEKRLKAQKWYDRAADQGHSFKKEVERLKYKVLRDSGDNPGALYHLGWMYEKGRGVTPDLNQAKSLYQKAADKGHQRAMLELKRLSS